MSIEIYQKVAFMSPVNKEFHDIIKSEDISKFKKIYAVTHDFYESKNYLFSSYDDALTHLKFVQNNHIYISKDDNKDGWSIITIYEGFPMYGEIETDHLQYKHIVGHF
jgi:hypothetical protein